MSVKGFKVDGQIEKYDYNALDNLPDVGADLAIDPDSNLLHLVDSDGNLIGDGVRIPTGGGSLSSTAISLLNTILSAAVYETDQTANIAALIAELSGGDTSGVIISFSGLRAIINNLQGTGISYSGKTATIGGN